MKLYTEEQVINSMKSVKYYIEHYDANVIDSIIDKHLKSLQPIKLPSDEETFEYVKFMPISLFHFQQCAKWVIEQIKKQEDNGK